MTSKDKTREKLVDSMRKTKAAARSQSDKKAGKSATDADQPQSGAKKTAGQSKSATARSKSKTLQPVGDPYQSGRRIWPD
jgi:hypothetical protein